ncbi:RHS repeat-associated core domain-containing protein [Pseudomonas syringae]|uniref:RHS repeat-associated core domain-containing protein n=1 Tax=Pseudomonas syringae TaxID=317 RepID=UPI000ACF6C5C|nr:RHS repeat-associated core domain-containing protein [Pseudomonas syringae]
MTAKHQALLCHYHYDALDRLASCSPAALDSIERFYQKSRLTTEIQGQIQRSLVQSDDQLLAQQTRRAAQIECALLGTDQQRSVLNTTEHLQIAYTPYGTRHPALDLPGFNGEQPDPVTGHYLLGNGYRAFNPILMRFNSPDSFSPFGEGGINAYAYCAGDPVNRVDPSGHMFVFLRSFFRFFKTAKPLGRVVIPSRAPHMTAIPRINLRNPLVNRRIGARPPADLLAAKKNGTIQEWVNTGNWPPSSEASRLARRYEVTPERLGQFPTNPPINRGADEHQLVFIATPQRRYELNAALTREQVASQSAAKAQLSRILGEQTPEQRRAVAMAMAIRAQRTNRDLFTGA